MSAFAPVNDILPMDYDVFPKIYDSFDDVLQAPPEDYFKPARIKVKTNIYLLLTKKCLCSHLTIYCVCVWGGGGGYGGGGVTENPL